MSTRARSAYPHLRLLELPTGDTLRGESLDETQPLLLRRRPTPLDDLPMRCLRCDGPVVRTSLPVRLDRPGVQVRLESLPAWVCTRCELPYYEERDVRRVRKALDALRDVAAPEEA